MQNDPVSPTSSPPTLTYEEMPVIEQDSNPMPPPVNTPESLDTEDRENVIPEASRVFGSDSSPAPVSEPLLTPEAFEKARSQHSAGGGKRPVGLIMFIVLLFGLGIWLSGQLRSFFAPIASDEVVVPTVSPFVPTTSVVPSASPSGSMTPQSWQVQTIISGVTKQAIPGVSYRLPGDVKTPVCDSTSCASSGTSLPGGTRFTVAPRGKGQLLPDFRGAILTDTTGKEFVMKQTTIGSISVYEYRGDFTGRTGGGYTFTKMRGVLVPVSDTFAIDFNHFAPTGATTDYTKDDLLFDEIIKSFQSSPALPLTSPTTKPSTSSAGF